MLKCPIDSCGRQFQNELTMIEHVKRRHPLQSQKVRQQTTNQMLEKQSKITEEMNKLPKMQRVLQMSKQKKPLEFQRRSSSKQKKEIKNLVQSSQIKVSEIISESRQLVDENANSKKLFKRPSLSKKSQQQVDLKKLPSITQSKVNKLKLQTMKSQFSSTLIKQPSEKLLMKNDSRTGLQSHQTQMYSTAPNFAYNLGKKLDLIKSRTRKEGEPTNRSSSKDLKPQQTSVKNMNKKRLSSHTAESLVQESTKQLTIKPAQRPVKRLLEKPIKKQILQQESILTNGKLSQSVFIQSNASSVKQLGNQVKKGFTFQPKSKLALKEDKKFIKKQKSPQSPQTTLTQLSQKTKKTVDEELNWKERTVTVRNKKLQNFTIPNDSQVEYLYMTNCGMKTIDLNECFSLISLGLTNNELSNFKFLQQTMSGGYENIEDIFIDHNKIQSLSSLPTYLQLKKLSLTFNNIKGLDELTKILVKFPLLQELDLAFNPVRKQPNYKVAVLTACKGLKRLDGMVVTKIDRQLAQEYHKMYYDYLNILPLSNNTISDSKLRPSTAVSINYQQELEGLQDSSEEMTEQELNQEIQILQKMIKQTKQQYEIIRQENATLQDQIATYENITPKESDGDFNPKVYAKLCKEIEQLEMLNFLQYASEKQLQQILLRKVKQKGITLDMLKTAQIKKPIHL